jgi:hypothetical protein
MPYGNNGIVPQFAYNSTTFSPTFAARQKQPIATLGQEESRHDSITVSGLMQSIHERTDRVFSLDFPFVPQSDLAGWDAFISWAIQGQQFNYIPDTLAPSTFVTCQLMSMSVPYKWVGYQLFSVSLKLRVVVSAQVGS